MTCGNLFSEQKEPKHLCSIRLSPENEVYYENRKDVSIDSTGLHIGGVFITHEAFDRLVEYKEDWKDDNKTYQGTPVNDKYFRQAEAVLLKMKNNLI
jgi:hypothetical protein